MSSTDIQYAACYTEHGIHAFDVDMHQPGRYSAFCLCGKSYGLGRNIAFSVTTEFNPDSSSACAECVKRVRALLLDVPGWTQDCDVCGKALGASAFLPDGRRKSGRRSTCTACVDQDRAAARGARGRRQDGERIGRLDPLYAVRTVFQTPVNSFPDSSGQQKAQPRRTIFRSGPRGRRVACEPHMPNGSL